MKYFGSRSVSSVMRAAVRVLRYALLAMLVITPLLGTVIILVSEPAGPHWLAEISGSALSVDRIAYESGLDYKDAREWTLFSRLPLAVKILMMPYFMAMLAFLIHILKRTERLFLNFTNEVVFTRDNVRLVSSISKLTIAYSVMSFSAGTLLVSVLLMVFCEVIKSGVDLQDDHDLTV